MSLLFAVREAIVSLPALDVPAWVRSNQTGIYLGVVLATIVIYDAGKRPRLVPLTVCAHL